MAASSCSLRAIDDTLSVKSFSVAAARSSRGKQQNKHRIDTLMSVTVTNEALLRSLFS
jgi:hypothetical protein